MARSRGISLKKKERERIKKQKKQAKLEKKGRIGLSKTPQQKQIEKIIRQQATDPTLTLKKMGHGWFPEIKKTDLELIRSGVNVKKGRLEFRLHGRYPSSANRVSFIVVRHGENYEKTPIGSFSVDLELNSIKRF